jgi:hypothetical protein
MLVNKIFQLFVLLELKIKLYNFFSFYATFLGENKFQRKNKDLFIDDNSAFENSKFHTKNNFL